MVVDVAVDVVVLDIVVDVDDVVVDDVVVVVRRQREIRDGVTVTP